MSYKINIHDYISMLLGYPRPELLNKICGFSVLTYKCNLLPAILYPNYLFFTSHKTLFLLCIVYDMRFNVKKFPPPFIVQATKMYLVSTW